MRPIQPAADWLPACGAPTVRPVSDRKLCARTAPSCLPTPRRWFRTGSLRALDAWHAPREGRGRGRARSRLHAAKTHGNRPVRPGAPTSRVVPCPRARQLRRRTPPLRRAGAARFPQVRGVLGGLHSRAMRCLRPRSARGVLLPQSQHLSELLRKAHGRRAAHLVAGSCPTYPCGSTSFRFPTSCAGSRRSQPRC